MTENGGDSSVGTIYSFNMVTTILTVVHSFNKLNGEGPLANNLIQASDGLLYGMTFYGGSAGKGVLFSFDPIRDTELVLVNFTGANGSWTDGGLVQDPDNGLLYGMTYMGGTNNTGVLFSYDITTAIYTVLFCFTGANGEYPIASLALVKDTSIETGINKATKNNGNVSIYPNPSTAIFTIVLVGAQNLVPATVEVYNVLGKKVLKEIRQLADDNLINLSNQPNGIYFYRVLQEDGNLLGEGKIIVQK